MGTQLSDVSPAPGVLTTDAKALALRLDTLTATATPVTPETLIALIDHTTLKATDTPNVVTAHLDAALKGPTLPAAVCVTPDYAKRAVEHVKDTLIAVASVAGAFPHGRSLTNVIQHEIVGVLDAGVDELDIVLDRAAFLSGDTTSVFDQIAWARHTCDRYTASDGKPRRIKLILETGELGTLTAVRDAAWLALHAGADMVKTSTGTIPAGADPATVLLLCDVVATFNARYDTLRGVKVSGGLSSSADAQLYFAIVQSVFGAAATDPLRLRFGASKLLGALQNEVSA